MLLLYFQVFHVDQLRMMTFLGHVALPLACYHLPFIIAYLRPIYRVFVLKDVSSPS